MGRDTLTNTSPRQYLDDVPREIQDLIYEGRKIQAIKLERETNGLGLKEAKDKIEAIEAQMRSRFPTAMPARKNLGCGTALLLIALFLAIGAAFAIGAIR
jgi:hypothetical protein